jgi:hypothetical protein
VNAIKPECFVKIPDWRQQRGALARDRVCASAKFMRQWEYRIGHLAVKRQSRAGRQA